VHGNRYYRCRYPTEYAQSRDLDHPLTVNLGEPDVLPQIDDWLAELFDPSRIETIPDRLLDPDWAHERERLNEELRDRDRRVRRYRALRDGGADPDLVAGWRIETAVLAAAQPGGPVHTACRECGSCRRATRTRITTRRAQP
jgi:hypothetical protein